MAVTARPLSERFVFTVSTDHHLPSYFFPRKLPEKAALDAETRGAPPAPTVPHRFPLTVIRRLVGAEKGDGDLGESVAKRRRGGR